MKERVQEIYESLQERLKSPFILSFIVIWCIHHWRIFFYLLSFDNDINQGHKLEIIEVYINNHDGWWGMI